MDEKTKKLHELMKEAKSKHSDGNLLLVIPDFMSRSFSSFCSIRSDLLLIIKYLNKLETENDKIITTALTYSLISIYGKCFTDASQSKLPKLEAKQIFSVDSDLILTHKYLMDLRHNFIAHRGDNEHEVKLAYIMIPIKDGEHQIKYAHKKLIKLDIEKRKDILKLIHHILPYVIERIQQSGQKAHNALFGNFEFKQLKYMILNNATD